MTINVASSIPQVLAALRVLPAFGLAYLSVVGRVLAAIAARDPRIVVGLWCVHKRASSSRLASPRRARRAPRVRSLFFFLASLLGGGRSLFFLFGATTGRRSRHRGWRRVVRRGARPSRRLPSFAGGRPFARPEQQDHTMTPYDAGVMRVAEGDRLAIATPPPGALQSHRSGRARRCDL